MPRFGIFTIIGLTGFAFQTGLIALLTRLSGWRYTIVVPTTAEITVLLSFFWHAHWTWADRPIQGVRSFFNTLFQYQLTRTIGIFASYMLTLTIVSSAHLAPELANAVAVGCISIANFAFADRLIFRTT